MTDYLDHGPRHGPLGSDPIPGGGQVAFATLKPFAAQTVTSGVTPQYIDMEDGVTGSFETSEPTIFENAANAGLSGSPWGIKCLANGTYIVQENYFVRNGTAGAQVTCYHTFTGGGGESDYRSGRNGALVGDTWDVGHTYVHLFFEEWTDANDTNPAPVYVNPYAILASGSNITVDSQTMVIYLGPYAGTGAL